MVRGFRSLDGLQQGVAYGEDGTRFMGATFDPSGLYRQSAVFEWMQGLGLTVEAIHAHVLELQRPAFGSRLRAGGFEGLRGARLVTPIEDRRRGHFLTFETGTAAALHDELLARRIVTDVRGDRIRFGFGCYHAPRDIDRAVERLKDEALA